MTAPLTSAAPPEGRTIPPGTRILTTYPVALPQELEAITEVVPRADDKTRHQPAVLGSIRLRLKAVGRSWRLFRRAPGYSAVITVGDLEGLVFAALLRFRRRSIPVHVMYDCLWYGGGWLRRAWMRLCLSGVDQCVVWASVERERYAEAYGVSRNKFSFVPHHHSLKHYTWESGDEGYVFTGGNSDRDFRPFFEAVRYLPMPCILATNRQDVLAGLNVPANVRVVSVSPSEFRHLMARARIVVMPMRATLLRTGAQQSILNAMLMGKPVILTDPAGGADYIESGRTGVLVPYGDAAALRDQIVSLWDRPPEAALMSARAQEVAAQFTVERTNTEMWNIALQLVQDRLDQTSAQASAERPVHTERRLRAKSV